MGENGRSNHNQSKGKRDVVGPFELSPIKWDPPLWTWLDILKTLIQNESFCIISNKNAEMNGCFGKFLEILIRKFDFFLEIFELIDSYICSA